MLKKDYIPFETQISTLATYVLESLKEFRVMSLKRCHELINLCKANGFKILRISNLPEIDGLDELIFVSNLCELYEIIILGVPEGDNSTIKEDYTKWYNKKFGALKENREIAEYFN